MTKTGKQKLLKNFAPSVLFSTDLSIGPSSLHPRLVLHSHSLTAYRLPCRAFQPPQPPLPKWPPRPSSPAPLLPYRPLCLALHPHFLTGHSVYPSSPPPLHATLSSPPPPLSYRPLRLTLHPPSLTGHSLEPSTPTLLQGALSSPPPPLPYMPLS